MIFIGIDPGVSGGIAAIDGSDGMIELWPMPKTTKDIVAVLASYAHNGHYLECFAIVEQVWGFPGQMKPIFCPHCKNALKVKQNQGAKSLTTFMKNAGAIEGILAALGIPHDFVSPNRWERDVGVFVTHRKGAPRITKTEKKNLHKAKCQRLFPEVNITHATCDALLLAEFCRMMKGAF